MAGIDDLLQRLCASADVSPVGDAGNTVKYGGRGSLITMFFMFWPKKHEEHLLWAENMSSHSLNCPHGQRKAR